MQKKLYHLLTHTKRSTKYNICTIIWLVGFGLFAIEGIAITINPAAGHWVGFWLGFLLVIVGVRLYVALLDTERR